ncbi:hypothetical protein DV704_09360 [Meiothermus sp. QL-1]|uniref:cupredoxin domain-containing protein n=1 Tax=Meiothermus sp. QL-1 TaxID=2058095 RepID=UPI000E0A58A3|nr:plastocyanin/azurin family copper-binding protein [Meiothermus sp. QL-1]RDI94866.1 hypothetical protein DV704_09360 [Meiothermus sp. QL-1]
MPVLLFLGLVLLAACSGANTPTACAEVRMVSPTQPFNPSLVTLKKGGCIEFFNADQGVHDAVSVPSTPAALQFSTRRLNGGERQRVVFNLAGEIEYICTVNGHAQLGMRGRIVVEP